MTDIPLNFNELMTQYGGMVLLPLSVVLVVAGLIQWVLGMRFLRSTAGLAGAVIGLLVVMVFTQRQLLYMVAVPVAAGILAAFLSRPVFVLATVGLIGVSVFFVLTNPAKGVFAPTPMSQQQDVAAKAKDLFEKASTTMTKFVELLKNPPRKEMGISLIAAGVALFIGIFLMRFYIAAMCSVFGTSLLTAGLAITMKLQGENLDTIIADKKLLIAGGLVVVWLLGTVINLKLCPKKQKKKSKEELAKEALEGTE